MHLHMQSHSLGPSRSRMARQCRQPLETVTIMTSLPIDKSPKGRASLSTSRIVFLVIAAAAPLASMIGNLPIALGLGNGAGTPGAFAIAGVILLCFAVGYAAMSRRIVATGAFYTYITEGLGTTLGVSSAYTALVAYLAFTF